MSAREDIPLGPPSQAKGEEKSGWIEALRVACAERSQKVVAAEIGYSQPVVNQVLRGVYTGNVTRVQAAVEGALMHGEVDCPVLGLIPRQRCIEYQRRPFMPTNPTAVMLYRACRRCPNSLNREK
jgi:DNA-binding transcriptional regulator YdaS (Cro superfamily)